MLENEIEPNWRKNREKGKLGDKKLNNSLIPIIFFSEYPKPTDGYYKGPDGFHERACGYLIFQKL